LVVARNVFSARLKWLGALPLLAVILAMAAIAIGALSGAQSNAGGARDHLFDVYQRLKPAAATSLKSFHVVAIDAESLKKIGPWPWPRTILAEIAKEAEQAGAKGFILVEPVDSPDPLSPESIGAFWLSGARDEEFARQLALLPSTDEALADALQGLSAGVAVGAAPPAPAGAPPLMERADARAADWLKLKSAASGEFLALPQARLRAPLNPALDKAARAAAAPLRLDGDGLLREATLLWSVDGAPRPSLALEGALLATGKKTVLVGADESAVSASGRIPRSLTLGAHTIALTPSSGMRLHLPRFVRGGETPAWKVLDKAASNGQLRDKVVYVGLDATQGRRVETDRGAVSVASAHALSAAQLAAGAALTRPSWAGYLEAVAVMLFGAAAIMWSQRLDLWKSLGIAALCATALLAGSIAAFSFGGMLLDPLSASLALFLGAFTVAGGRQLSEVMRDDAVRGSFHGALPEPTMKKLREDGAGEVLNGDFRPVTILACDLTLSEDDIQKLAATPDDVTKILASATADLKKTIIETGGAVEQAEGGKVFAYFNAPLKNDNHIEAACAAALRLIESMDKVNAEFEQTPRLRGVQVHLAIGAASGDCFVGPMGHGRNHRYSAIGPAADMASFLRGQASTYGPAVIADETVHRKANHHFAFLELDRLKFRKGERAQTVFALIGNPFIKSSKSYRALEESQRNFLAAYRAGNFEEARKLLAKAKEAPGARIALFDVYEARLKQLGETAPEGWDGAHPAAV
jgi:adenylate cyclase